MKINKSALKTFVFHEYFIIGCNSSYSTSVLAYCRNPTHPEDLDKPQSATGASSNYYHTWVSTTAFQQNFKYARTWSLYYSQVSEVFFFQIFFQLFKTYKNGLYLLIPNPYQNKPNASKSISHLVVLCHANVGFSCCSDKNQA